MAPHVNTPDDPKPSFAAADCDCLSLSDAIRKFVFDPNAQELGEVVGALRSDGWVWLRITSKDWKAHENVLSVTSDNFYCIKKDGTFIANPADLLEIERNGIEGYRCERLSGAALHAERQSWMRLLFECDPGWIDLSAITANLVGVAAEDFIWPIDLTVEDILPAIRSLAELAERPIDLDAVRLDAIRSVARQIAKRWHDLIGFLRRGELVAMGVKKYRRERLSAQFWSGDKAYIDVQTGNCGHGFDREGKLTDAWSDIQLWISETHSATEFTAPKDVSSRKPLQGPSFGTVLPRRPRGPDGKKTRAAAEKLRGMLRNGEITPTELINPVGEGGRKQQEIANLLGVQSRTTAKSVVKMVLSEIEFANSASTDKH